MSGVETDLDEKVELVGGSRFWMRWVKNKDELDSKTVIPTSSFWFSLSVNGTSIYPVAQV